MKKNAIAVYSPTEPTNSWEKALQDASKHFLNEWMPIYPCKLVAKAITSLKAGTDWLDNPDLFPIRASYFFNPQLMDHGACVFTTKFLFLRDILENNEISTSLHFPICLVTSSLAKFLFLNNSVHIYINADLFKAANRKCDFVNIGGLLITEQDVIINSSMITNIKYYGERPAEVTKLIESLKVTNNKIAATSVHDEIFKIDEHNRIIKPGMTVLDKITNTEARITEVEPGISGIVRMTYTSGGEHSISKEDFDNQFIIS